MKRIILFCANGFSTAMFRDKIRKAIESSGLDYSVDAYAYSELPEFAGLADVILLGPQIRFNLRHVQSNYPNKPVEVIDMQTYAAMDGEKILSLVREKLGD